MGHIIDGPSSRQLCCAPHHSIVYLNVLVVPAVSTVYSLTAHTFATNDSALLQRNTWQPLPHIDCATTVLSTIEK